jgi:hypothetical protein
MTSPHRVAFVKQLDGSRYAGSNCTMAALAMAIDRATLGRTRTTGAECRRRSGDTVGGTNLDQARQVAYTFGVVLETHRGMPWTVADANLREGRGFILQGSSSATRGTAFQASETFAGNHAWWVNQGRGWHQTAAGNWQPTDYLVFDPLADGRRRGIALSPMWIPRRIVRDYAARLVLSGAILGQNRVYAGFVRDTEPHAHYRYGGAATKPFPDKVRTWNAVADRRINVRTAPTLTAEITDRLPVGTSWTAYQVTHTGALLAGSRTWYGNHNGNRWIHASGLRGIGGTS